jgi:hypothetical protein
MGEYMNAWEGRVRAVLSASGSKEQVVNSRFTMATIQDPGLGGVAPTAPLPVSAPMPLSDRARRQRQDKSRRHVHSVRNVLILFQ